jgi:basic amino acid/polyamine antiporter, APA family
MSLWTTKSIEKIIKEAGEHKLKRSLGPVALIMLGIGAIIGAGLFSLTGIAAAENSGPAIAISFIIAAIGCAFAGMCYSEFSSMIPISGSAYTYAYATMGEFAAWVIGWALVLEYATGAAAVSISWSAYLVSFLHDFGVDLPAKFIASPWHPVHLHDGSIVYGWINLPALAIVMLVSCLLIRGVHESARVNAIFVVVKVAVVLIFVAIGAFYIKAENFHPYIPPNTGTFGEYGWSGILRAAGVVFFAYIGFDAVSTAAQEAKNPQRNMPIGIIGSLVICTVLYIIFSTVLIGLVDYRSLADAAPVALAIDQTPYPWLNWCVKLAIISGLSSVILVLLLGQSRIFYIMASDGLIPKFFSRIHRRYHTPWGSNLVLMIFVGLFGAFAPLELVGHMTSIGTLLAFVIVCAGVIILRKTRPDLPRPFKVPFVPLVPLLGIAVCLLLMFSLGWLTWLRLILWLAVGLSIYFSYGQYHSKHRKDIKTPPF